MEFGIFLSLFNYEISDTMNVNNYKGVKGMTTFMGLICFVALIATIVYAVKWFKNKKSRTLKNKYRKRFVISIVLMFASALIAGPSDDTSKTASNSADTSRVERKKSAPKVKTKTTYVGKGQYKIAKKENVALLAKKKKLLSQEADLQSQQDKIESDEAQAKQKADEEQAAAQKQQEQQAKEAQKQQEQQSQASQEQSQQSTQTRGDMNTSDTGDIVGNSNSHIYHMPGQRGYNMNSSNAVHFKTEQDAINAGYRKAKV